MCPYCGIAHRQIPKSCLISSFDTETMFNRMVKYCSIQPRWMAQLLLESWK